jgi:hypothetical protein
MPVVFAHCFREQMPDKTAGQIRETNRLQQGDHFASRMKCRIKAFSSCGIFLWIISIYVQSTLVSFLSIMWILVGLAHWIVLSVDFDRNTFGDDDSHYCIELSSIFILLEIIILGPTLVVLQQYFCSLRA